MACVSLILLILLTVNSFCLPIDNLNSDSHLSEDSVYNSAPDIYNILNVQALQIKYLSDRIDKQETIISQLTDKPKNIYAREVYTRGGAYADLTQAEGECNTTMRDCLELYLNGCRYDGVYLIDPSLNGNIIRAYCDMTNAGGGWTIIQRRVGDDVDFFRNREQYKCGFGNLLSSYWIGLDNIRALTVSDNDETTEIYIHLEDFEDQSRFAKYSNFSIADYKDNYRLYVDGYYGTAGDDFSKLNNQTFSTHDNDVDNDPTYSCALDYEGGWWFDNCYECHLNGLYYRGSAGHPKYDGVIWHAWKGWEYSLKTSVMKIRRLITHTTV